MGKFMRVMTKQKSTDKSNETTEKKKRTLLCFFFFCHAVYCKGNSLCKNEEPLNCKKNTLRIIKSKRALLWLDCYRRKEECRSINKAWWCVFNRNEDLATTCTVVPFPLIALLYKLHDHHGSTAHSSSRARLHVLPGHTAVSEAALTRGHPRLELGARRPSVHTSAVCLRTGWTCCSGRWACLLDPWGSQMSCRWSGRLLGKSTLFLGENKRGKHSDLLIFTEAKRNTLTDEQLCHCIGKTPPREKRQGTHHCFLVLQWHGWWGHQLVRP